MKLRTTLTIVITCISFIFFLLLQTSCTKTITKTVIDTLKTAWQPVAGFTSYGSSPLSSASIGDSVLVVASNYNYITLVVNKNGFTNFFGNNLIGTSLNAPAYICPYVNNDLCAYTTSTSLNVMSVPIYSQYSSFSYTPVYTPGLTSVFQQTCSYPEDTYPSSGYPVIRNKYILTPVEEDANMRVRFDLLSFDSSQILSYWGFGGVPTVKSIYLTPAVGTIGFSWNGYFCASFFGKFFVEYGSQFFRIDTLGNVKQFGYTPAKYSKNYGIYNMFTYGNTLFVNSGGVFFSSDDQGETWKVFNDFTNTNVGLLIFRNVGSKLYATAIDLDAQLFKVAFTGNNLNFSELNNDGLQYYRITSITQCGRYDFITTSSGVFYRDTAYFDQLKSPVR